MYYLTSLHIANMLRDIQAWITISHFEPDVAIYTSSDEWVHSTGDSDEESSSDEELSSHEGSSSDENSSSVDVA